LADIVRGEHIDDLALFGHSCAVPFRPSHPSPIPRGLNTLTAATHWERSDHFARCVQRNVAMAIFPH
jgi:hypothetical protein